MSSFSTYRTCGSTDCGKTGYWKGKCIFCGFDKTNADVRYERDNPRKQLQTRMTNRQRVVEFNQQVLGIHQRPVGLMDPAEMSFSLEAIREETQELEDAFDEGDLVGAIDALVDLDYFVRGIVYKHGITPEMYSRIFAVVHEANMQKQIGASKASRSAMPLDAIKPEGWVSPEDRIRQILEEYVK